ncbi:MAG: hypothetical protein KDA17_02890 [Candidatus Saccharibacteria bacterium]|nr:hypothetical protein [Candidatus Saccharibacteria bacterium]
MMIRRLKSALVWLVGGAVAFNAGLQLIPGEAFMTVRNIYVADAWYGQTPVMQVSRTIRKAFWAEWSVELEERTELGQYIFVAKAAGSNSYTPESKLPKAFTLDWWTFPTQLRPARGVYRIETCWEIRTQGFPVKEVCKHSNDFRIK